MMKTSASHFKAKLGQYMREVRAGREVLVTDRDEPIAKLVPAKKPAKAQALQIVTPREPAAPPLGRIKVRGIPFRGTDSTSWLTEDRRRR